MSDDASKGAPRPPAESTPDLDQLDSEWDGDENDGGATVVGRLEDLVAATRIDSEERDTDRPSDVITARPPPMAPGTTGTTEAPADAPTVVVEGESTVSEVKVEGETDVDFNKTSTAPPEAIPELGAAAAAAGEAESEDEEDDEDEDDEVDDSAWDLPESPEPPEVASLSPEERAAAKKQRDEARAARKEKAKAKALAARERKKARAEAAQKKQKKQKKRAKSIRPPKPARSASERPAARTEEEDAAAVGEPSVTMRRPRKSMSRGRDWQRMAAFVIAVVVVGALMLWLLQHHH